MFERPEWDSWLDNVEEWADEDWKFIISRFSTPRWIELKEKLIRNGTIIIVQSERL